MPHFCQGHQGFMKPKFTMNSNENSKISYFHSFHTIGAIVYHTLVVSKGDRRFKFVDFEDFASKITFRYEPRSNAEN